MYCLFVYKEFIVDTNSGYNDGCYNDYDCSEYGNDNSNLTLSPYNTELLISGPDKYVRRFIQMLATVFKMVATEHIDNGYIRKAVIGYEDVTKVFPDDLDDGVELFVCNPKFPCKLPHQIPIDNKIIFEKADWEPDYEAYLKRRVTLDIDRRELSSVLSNYEITPVYKYGDPDYVSYHARKYVSNHREYYNAIKEKVQLCAQGIADMNHFLHSYIYGAWDVLFNEKLEITKASLLSTKEHVRHGFHVSYHYEKGHDLLKPIYETKVYRIDRQDILNIIPSRYHLLCKISTKYIYVSTDNKTLTIYGRYHPYAYTTNKRLHALNTNLDI